MRIHTDNLTPRDLFRAVDSIDGGGVTLEYTVHESRSHRQAYEVTLRGHGVRHTRRPNSGTGGAGDEYAATYDDWGWFLAALYAWDASIKAGPYKSRTGFNISTKDRYRVER